jgi:hypothetical protein
MYRFTGAKLLVRINMPDTVSRSGQQSVLCTARYRVPGLGRPAHAALSLLRFILSGRSITLAVAFYFPAVVF